MVLLGGGRCWRDGRGGRRRRQSQTAREPAATADTASSAERRHEELSEDDITEEPLRPLWNGDGEEVQKGDNDREGT